MSREIVTLVLQRQEKNQPWGFRIIGGTDEALLLKVYKVSCIKKSCKKLQFGEVTPPAHTQRKTFKNAFYSAKLIKTK